MTLSLGAIWSLWLKVPSSGTSFAFLKVMFTIKEKSNKSKNAADVMLMLHCAVQHQSALNHPVEEGWFSAGATQAIWSIRPHPCCSEPKCILGKRRHIDHVSCGGYGKEADLADLSVRSWATLKCFLVPSWVTEVVSRGLRPPLFFPPPVCAHACTKCGIKAGLMLSHASGEPRASGTEGL